MQEIWKDLPSHKGYYQLSNLGRLKALGRISERNGRPYVSKDKILSNNISNGGYCIINLCNPVIHTTVHRLTALTFIPNPENKPCVNHKNGIKTDNRVKNLEWCTQSENMKHSVKNGLHKYKKSYANHNSKTILQFDIKGNFIKEYGSVNEASKQNGIYTSDICRCANGTRNIKHAGGFIWKYKEH